MGKCGNILPIQQPFGRDLAVRGPVFNSSWSGRVSPCSIEPADGVPEFGPVCGRNHVHPSPMGLPGNGHAGPTYADWRSFAFESVDQCADFRRSMCSADQQFDQTVFQGSSSCCAKTGKLPKHLSSGAVQTGGQSWQKRSRSLLSSRRHSHSPPAAKAQANGQQPALSSVAQQPRSRVRTSSTVLSSAVQSAPSAARSLRARQTATKIYRRSLTGTFRAVGSNASGGLFACLGA